MTEAKGLLHLIVKEEQTENVITGATVVIVIPGRSSEVAVTDENGSVRFFTDVPSAQYSRTAASREKPYLRVDVRVYCEGYAGLTVVGEQIFDRTVTKHTLYLCAEGKEKVIAIPEHPLYAGTCRFDPTDPRAVTDRPKSVVIPQTIRVHLGAPNASARNVTVPFIDYIKNVACSEIYPTWPEPSLIANVIAQVSLALNRIYTEWYPSQGYDFDITNSTAYDQYYVHERGIFDSIDRVVDGYFTNYLARGTQLEPLFALYCDGANVTCAGMSQWGTVTLAKRGYTPLQILRYYYGANVDIRQAPVVSGVQSSFPGVLSRGDASSDVLTLQNRLNRIAIAFPSIPFNLPTDGVFGPKTESAVKAFQNLFRLNATGRVDRETWYRIQYIYTAVKKLAELGSEGEYPQTDAFPGRVLQVGSRGTEVLRIQRYLSFLSAKLGTAVVPNVTVDGVFGTRTQSAVRVFQNYYGLSPTGTVGESTWNAIVTTYYALGGGNGSVSPEAKPYPGTPLRLGSRGENVVWLQTALNAVLPGEPVLVTDGIFGNATLQNVRTFQRSRGLAVDGVVGPATWSALSEEYRKTQ